MNQQQEEIPFDSSIVESTAVKTVKRLKSQKSQIMQQQDQQLEDSQSNIKTNDSSNNFEQDINNNNPNQIKKRHSIKLKRPISSSKKKMSSTKNVTEKQGSATSQQRPKPKSQTNVYNNSLKKIPLPSQNKQQQLQQQGSSQDLQFQQQQQNHQKKARHQSMIQDKSFQQSKKNPRQPMNFNKNLGIDDLDDEFQSNTNEIIQMPKQLYYNIDLNMAVEFFITKGRLLKEKIEVENIDPQIVDTLLIKNPVFHIQYNHMLQQMCQQKVINEEFRNMQKKPFDKIEKFFIQKLDENIARLQLEQEIIKKTKRVKDQLKRKTHEIKEQIQAEIKQDWNWDDL